MIHGEREKFSFIAHFDRFLDVLFIVYFDLHIFFRFPIDRSFEGKAHTNIASIDLYDDNFTLRQSLRFKNTAFVSDFFADRGNLYSLNVLILRRSKISQSVSKV